GASGASEQIAVQAPCRIVTFEKVTQNFLGKNFVFLNWFLKAAFFLTALKNCVFLNQLLKTSFFLTAHENFVLLDP
ncbi:MAG: hypothetical protein RR980_05740, partial [Mucinivorans sp.]